MLSAFGRPDPLRFSYRTGDAIASVWDWTFRADPSRAPEFLQVDEASPAGLKLTGSGTEWVTTPGFRHGEIVLVAGAGGPPLPLRADGEGHLSFPVNMGPAHSLEQGTADEVAAESANTAYFVKRDVRFQRLGL
jgi:hypothetical protein